MDSDSWTNNRLSTASKRYQSALQSRSDLYLGFDEIDVSDDNESRGAEFACPFCMEDFDIIGLCCHIDDEHPVESKNGVECGRRKNEIGLGMPRLWDEGGDEHEPDPLLSSFVHNYPLADESTPALVHSSAESSLVEKSSDLVLESAQPCPLSEKEQKEKAQRCDFVQDLLLSTILGDTL
ncbi:hypothetical protein IFM89_032902 [Coptis chinensis]|uniref:Dehydration-induced 19-like protein n=1 Tax=Coptis chinensis TaxID=261450 RepID=A0A835IU68_9MAGN|nr:hypothetical protein IFM89_032902 [Coptis chinensis]